MYGKKNFLLLYRDCIMDDEEKRGYKLSLCIIKLKETGTIKTVDDDFTTNIFPVTTQRIVIYFFNSFEA